MADPVPAIVIVGGGVTGLTAARAAAIAAPGATVTLLEAAERLGGKILTVHDGGFTVEAGPESYLAAKGWMTELLDELGVAGELAGTRPENRGSRVRWGGELHRIPDGLSGLVPTRLRPVLTSSLLSARGKARLALDLVLPRRRDPDDESLERFISRRLGREAYERLIEPLMAGIYGGDGGRLSTLATFPQLRAAEQRHGSVIRGVIASRRRTTGAGATTPSGFLAPVAGMGRIVDALATDLVRLDVAIRTGVTVTRLIRSGPGSGGRMTVELAGGERLPADAIVLATPARVTADLLNDDGAGLAPQAAVHLRAFEQTDSLTLSLAFHRADIGHALQGYGYVVPRAQRLPILASTWTSSKWDHRAPDGSVLLRFYIGRAGDRPAMTLSDDEAERLALDEMAATLGARPAPTHRWVFRWPGGNPQYTVGHLDRVAEIERRVATVPGLAIAGCAYHGVGIPDCVRSGERAARAVAAQVARAV